MLIINICSEPKGVEVVEDLGTEGVKRGEGLFGTDTAQERDGKGLVVEVTVEIGDMEFDGEGIGAKSGIFPYIQ